MRQNRPESRWTGCCPYSCCRLISKHHVAWWILNHGVCTAKNSDSKEKRRQVRHAVSVSNRGVPHTPTEPRTLGPGSLRMHQVQISTQIRLEPSNRSFPCELAGQAPRLCKSQPPNK
jgi:hypothetical protein